VSRLSTTRRSTRAVGLEVTAAVKAVPVGAAPDRTATRKELRKLDDQLGP
jgi:hypothetical protein